MQRTGLKSRPFLLIEANQYFATRGPPNPILQAHKTYIDSLAEAFSLEY